MLYLVGGYLRDQYLGFQSKDKHYAFDGDLAEMLDFIVSRGWTVLNIQATFKTARVKLPNNEVVDFAVCREEVDYDGRSPKLVKATTIEGDLARRDFTVNALAQPVDENLEFAGDVFDPFNGLEDIASKTLRFVGDPKERLWEDGLRWLRALRLSLTKELRIEDNTHKALMESTPETFRAVCTDRIREEINRMLVCNEMEAIRMLYSVYPTIWTRPDLHMEIQQRGRLK